MKNKILSVGRRPYLVIGYFPNEEFRLLQVTVLENKPLEVKIFAVQIIRVGLVIGWQRRLHPAAALNKIRELIKLSNRG